MAEPHTVRENANALNSEQIAALLPHRYPFALVDRILDYEPGQWAIGRKCVSRMRNSSAVTSRASRSCQGC